MTQDDMQLVGKATHFMSVVTLSSVLLLLLSPRTSISCGVTAWFGTAKNLDWN